MLEGTLDESSGSDSVHSTDKKLKSISVSHKDSGANNDKRSYLAPKTAIH